MSQLNILENEFIELNDSYNYVSNVSSPKNILYETMNDAPIADVANVIVTRIKKQKDALPEINYTNYSNNNITLKNYKIPELKAAAKHNNLHISGTKHILISRLMLHFEYVKNTIVIQRLFRGFIVRLSIKLRGPALINRAMCVNDTDFVTLEPLNEIEHDNFYSYTDKTNFTYGFNLTSLIQMIMKQNQRSNPYNRENFERSIVLNIITLRKLTNIIYKEQNDTNIGGANESTTANNRIRTNVRRTTRRTISSSSQISGAPSISVESQQRYIHILTTRNMPTEQRMLQLFMEIDNLGNYTHVNWFSNLDLRQYIRLYRAFYDVWNYRSQLSRQLRNDICPFFGPFDNIFDNNTYHSDLNIDQIRNGCLTVFENMVYSGIDEDHRKLGTFHALSALTMVSIDARNAMPWLYESVVY